MSLDLRPPATALPGSVAPAPPLTGAVAAGLTASRTPTLPAAPAALPTAGAASIAFAGPLPDPTLPAPAAHAALTPAVLMAGDLSELGQQVRTAPGQPQMRPDRAAPEAPGMRAKPTSSADAATGATVRGMDGFAIRLLHRLTRHDAEEAGNGRATPVAGTAEASVQQMGREDGAPSAGRQESGTALAEWRQLWIALPPAVSPSPLHLQWRERGEEARANGLGRRFLINVRLTRLGALELDGLMSDSGDRFDLIVRSEAMLPPAVRSGVRQMFETALDILSARGGLAFKAEGQHATETDPCDRPLSAAGVLV